MQQSPSEEAKMLSASQEINRIFNGDELLASHPTPKLEDHSFSAVRD
jgi:hypothetical protein